MGRTYLRCPDCKKKGVYVKETTESWWYCRYCGWNACTDIYDPLDKDRRQLLKDTNPDADVKVYWQ